MHNHEGDQSGKSEKMLIAAIIRGELEKNGDESNITHKLQNNFGYNRD